MSERRCPQCGGEGTSALEGFAHRLDCPSSRTTVVGAPESEPGPTPPSVPLSDEVVLHALERLVRRSWQVDDFPDSDAAVSEWRIALEAANDVAKRARVAFNARYQQVAAEALSGAARVSSPAPSPEAIFIDAETLVRESPYLREGAPTLPTDPRAHRLAPDFLSALLREVGADNDGASTDLELHIAAVEADLAAMQRRAEAAESDWQAAVADVEKLRAALRDCEASLRTARRVLHDWPSIVDLVDDSLETARGLALPNKSPNTAGGGER